MNVILDANVLVSSLFGGVPEQAVRRAFKERLFVSSSIEEVFDSLGKKLTKRLSPEKFKVWTHVFLPSVLGRCQRAVVHRRVEICRDPKDNAYLSLALEIAADVLVTGDKDLLSLSEGDLARAGLGRLKIITPGNFVVFADKPEKT